MEKATVPSSKRTAKNDTTLTSRHLWGAAGSTLDSCRLIRLEDRGWSPISILGRRESPFQVTLTLDAYLGLLLATLDYSWTAFYGRGSALAMDFYWSLPCSELFMGAALGMLETVWGYARTSTFWCICTYGTHLSARKGKFFMHDPIIQNIRNVSR